MLKISLFSNETLIGSAELVADDPPMGVAAGVLLPTAAYDPLRAAIDQIALSGSGDWSSLSLRALTDAGDLVDGSIWIESSFGDQEQRPLITVAGIDCASGRYEAWFGTDPAYIAYHEG